MFRTWRVGWGRMGSGRGVHPAFPWDRLRFDAATVWSMPTMNPKLVPAELLDPVVAYFNPRRVIVFGSVARGDDGPDSDIDLLVIEPTAGNTRNESVRIRRALGDIGYPVDVIVMATERFEETKGIIGGVAYPAHKYGRVLYEAA